MNIFNEDREDKLIQAIAELSERLRQKETNDEALQVVLRELRDATVTQSGALAVIASKVVEGKKKAMNTTKLLLVLSSSLRNSRRTTRLSESSWLNIADDGTSPLAPQATRN